MLNRRHLGSYKLSENSMLQPMRKVGLLLGVTWQNWQKLRYSLHAFGLLACDLNAKVAQMVIVGPLFAFLRESVLLTFKGSTS